MKAQRRQGT